MKKMFILSLIISFIAIFLTSSYEVKACDPGFTSKTVEMVIGGCTYVVDFCVDCATATHPGEVKMTGFRLKDNSCNPGLTFNQIQKEIETQASTFDFYITYLCDPFGVPDCKNGKSPTITYFHYVCWKMEGILYLGNFYVYYHPCDYNNYCREDCNWCIKNGIMIKTCNPYYMVGTINCTKESYEVTPPTAPGEVSDCFIYHTSCNP